MIDIIAGGQSTDRSYSEEVPATFQCEFWKTCRIAEHHPSPEHSHPSKMSVSSNSRRSKISIALVNTLTPEGGWRHYGDSVSLPLKKPYREQEKTSKPSAFWFSEGDSWHAWCISECFRNDTLYREGHMKPDTLVIAINTVESLDAFSHVYASSHVYERWNFGVDWTRVVREMPGVAGIFVSEEMQRYLRMGHAPYAWKYGWDVGSLALWDTTVVERFDDPVRVPSPACGDCDDEGSSDDELAQTFSQTLRVA